MLRYILYGLVMLLTFASGFGLERLVHYKPATEVAPVAKLPGAEQLVIPVPVTPVIPVATTAAEPSDMATPTLILDYDREKIFCYGILYIHGRLNIS